MPKVDNYQHIGIRLPSSLLVKIEFIRTAAKERTGFPLSKTSIIRTLLEEAIRARDEYSKTKETRR